MGKPSAPTPPDPARLAREQAEANRVTTFTPFGNINFGTVGEDGSFVPTQNGSQAAVQVSPTDTQLDTFNRQIETENLIANQLADRVSTLPTGEIDVSGLPELRTDFGAQGAELEDATFQRAMGLLSPVFDQREEQLRSQLRNQGLVAGSEAFDDEFGNFSRARNEAELAAAFDAVGAGRAEQSRLFGLNSAARQQGFGEQSFLRNQPFNELAAALSGTQIAPFQSQPLNVPGVDVLGANALNLQAQNNAFNAANQGRSDVLGGLFSLGGSALSAAPFFLASDRRLKEGVKRVGTLDNGLPVYVYRYKAGGPPQIGLMADDVEKVKPEAVASINGYKAVDYMEAVHA